MNIRLVPITASHLTELLRGMDNTGWLGSGYCVWQRKERESQESDRDGEKEGAGEREASKRGGQLHCITPF